MTFLRLWRVLLSALILVSLACADVQISRPLTQQLPPIAYPKQPFSFTVASSTFSFVVPRRADAPPSPPSILYSAQDLPSWLSFDAKTLTFSGTAPDSPSQANIVVKGTLAEGSPSLGGNTSATDQFTLLVLDEPAPVIHKPITQQLPAASSLGASHMIGPSTIRLPLGWSFAVGLQGDTFTIANGAKVFWSVTLADGSLLPDWLHYSPESFDLYGNAPTDVSSKGASYTIRVTGSNRPGYGGVAQTFTLVVSPHSLSLKNNRLQPTNGSVGTFLQYSIPLSNVEVDGSQLSPSENVNVTADLQDKSLSWLSFDQSARTLYGTVPYEPYGNASAVTQAQVPITFTGKNNTRLTVNQTITIAPSAFTAIELPNVFITQGNSVSVDLEQFLRNTTSTPKKAQSKRQSLPRRQAPSSDAQPSVKVLYTPSNATEWLKYDESALRLSGQVPKDWTNRVKIDMMAIQGPSNASSKATFYLAFDGDRIMGDPTGNNNFNGAKGEDHHSGLSQKAKVAIGASVGGAAALALILALLVCCRRRSNSNGRDADRSYANRSFTREDDEGTLTDKDRHYKKAIVVGRAGVGEAHTPSTVAVSPMPGFEENEKAGKHGMTPPRQVDSDLHSVVVVSPNGRQRDALHEAEAPMQSRLIANLFTGGRVRPQNNQRRASKVNSTGLGLSLGDDADHSDPFAEAPSPVGGVSSDSRGRIRHQRSRESVRSHRSSWESDLFYEDANSNQQHYHEAHAGHDEDDASQSHDLPRRRGKSTATALNVRHRNTHINESPAFHTSSVFTPSNAVGSSNSLDQIGMAAMDSGLSVDSGDFQDTQNNLSPHGSDDARILKARVMQVQRHSPILHQGSLTPVTPHAASARPYDLQNNGGAFDDAEDDVEWTNDDGFGNRRDDKRNSALSAMTEGSQYAGVRAHLAREAQAEARRVKSPDPSITDAASISAFDPRETMKPVMQARPQTPPRQQQQRPSNHTRGTSSTGSAASGRFLPCPTVNAVMGTLLSFHMFPSVPPPIAGAPSSPGKRSGRTVRYELAMDDDRAHLSQYKGQWPNMLGDWLSLDAQTFQVDGLVPRATELEQLGDCQIAMISTSRPSGDSPYKRMSASSYESARVNTIDEERTVVARAKLVFQNAAPRGNIPRLGHAF